MNEANWLENEANRHSTPDIQRACGISAVHFYPKPTQIAREMKGNKRHFNNEWYISIHIFTPQNSFKPFAKQTNTHMRSGSFEAQKNHALRHQKPLFATISTSGGPTRFNRMLYDVVNSKHCFNNAFSNKITHKSPRIWNWYASLGCIRWVKMWEIPHLRHPQCMDICIIVVLLVSDCNRLSENGNREAWKWLNGNARFGGYEMHMAKKKWLKVCRCTGAWFMLEEKIASTEQECSVDSIIGIEWS